MTIYRHVFISYSRNDTEFANSIVSALEQANIPVWIDREGIQHQDASFENKIREALSSAFAAVLIASPNALSSNYVQGELDLINAKAIPLFVVWAAGNDFIDTVPTYLSRRSYIDCRGNEASRGIAHLVQEVKKVQFQKVLIRFEIETSEDLISSHLEIKVGGNKSVAIDPTRYDDMHYFLNDLYLNHLKDDYPPFTYGTHWLLATASEEISRLALPWTWLSRRNETLTASQNDPKWLNSPLHKYGLVPSSTWEVLDQQDWIILGFLTNDRHLKTYVEELGTASKSREAASRLEKYIFWRNNRTCSPSEIAIDDFESVSILLAKSPNPSVLSRKASFHLKAIII